MSNASGRNFDNGDIIVSSMDEAIARSRNERRAAASAKRYVRALEHRAIVAKEWSALADDAITMGLRPKWWRFRARRRWDRNAARIIHHWQIWRDLHKEP